MCHKGFFLSLFFIAVSTVGSGQNVAGQQIGRSGTNDFWDQVRFGGGIGLGLNNGGFNASVSPSAIYQFNQQFAAGASLNFNYAKFQDARQIAYGGSILSLYNPIPYLQLSVELEQLRVNNSFENLQVRIEDNFWSPALFLGAGYTQQNFTVGIRYNALYDADRSIYFSAWIPFVRVYF